MKTVEINSVEKCRELAVEYSLGDDDNVKLGADFKENGLGSYKGLGD